MKKIIALLLVAVLAVLSLAACAPATPEYTVTVGVDRTEEEGAVVDTVVLLVLDKDGKIVKAAIDTLEVKSTQTEAQASKKDKGDSYGMKEGNGWGKAKYEWYEQAAAYEAALVGKTKDEALALEAKAGVLETTCTIGIDEFEAAVANAFENASKKTVKVVEGEDVVVSLKLTSTYADAAFSINYVASATVGEEKAEFSANTAVTFPQE